MPAKRDGHGQALRMPQLLQDLKMFGSGLDYHLGGPLHLELSPALFAGRWRRLGYGCCLASYALRLAMISKTGVTGWPATFRLCARVTPLAAGELSAIVVSGVDCCIRGRTGMKLLRLGSGGRLVCDYGWDHEPADVTEQAHQFLFEPIAVQSSFKVRDLLALMRECEPLQEIYAHWFVKEFLEDAELSAVEQTEPLYARVHFLRLETIWEKSDQGDFLDYDHSMNLSGYSMVQRKDRVSLMTRKGERIRYSVVGSLRPYLDLPLSVNPEIKVFRQGSSSPYSIEPFPEVWREKATLGQVIEGFFYGISMFGPPEKTEDLMLEINSIIEDPGAWHSGTGEELIEYTKNILGDQTSKSTSLMDHFMSRYPVKDLWQLEEKIRAADDEVPIKVSLKQKFGRRVELLPEFAELDGKAFRNLYRLRRMQYEL